MKTQFSESNFCILRGVLKKKAQRGNLTVHKLSVSISQKWKEHDTCRTRIYKELNTAGMLGNDGQLPEEAGLNPRGPRAMEKIEFCLNSLPPFMVQTPLPTPSTLSFPHSEEMLLLHLLLSMGTRPCLQHLPPSLCTGLPLPAGHQLIKSPVYILPTHLPRNIAQSPAHCAVRSKAPCRLWNDSEHLFQLKFSRVCED